MSEYRIIAHKFVIGEAWKMKDYLGKVVASRDAIFLKPNVHSLAAMFVGRLAALGPKPLANSSDPMVFDMEELPSAILEHPDWPLTETSGKIIVVPKAAVTSIRYPWYASLEIECGEHRFDPAPVFFFRSSVLRTLREFDWEI